MTATVHNYCEYRAKQRNDVRHQIAQIALTARALEVARGERFQGMGEVLDRGFDDDQESNLAGYNSRRSAYDGE